MIATKKAAARRVLATLTAVTALLLASAASADGPSVYGYWKHLDEDSGQIQSIFKIFEYQGKVVGKIVKNFDVPGKKAQERCTKCEGKLKDKPIKGLTFIWGLEKDEDEANKWVGGSVLNPDDGNTYNVELELTDDGKTLNVFGYMKMLVKVGGTSVWKRPTAEELKGIK